MAPLLPLSPPAGIFSRPRPGDMALRPTCHDCRHAAEHLRCAVAPQFPVPQPAKQTCSRGTWRVPSSNEDCPVCKGAGWLVVPGPAPQDYEECDLCFNPEGRPSP
ncbi:hypothetical protein SAMN02745194_03160 [Roseomonas rosea]|uniref:Uncharacterized protein n=1 Tax=Muricoccus roseus TaxID=198092 RepID=A0A1M6LFQ9_9PROT|nr:hypothetical protein SAMN02745194_03160 [Roseomonas rosea]